MRAPSKTHEKARVLRQAMTPPELALWVRLRTRADKGPRFRRQHPIGPYVLDLYCSTARLAIEVDGVVHGHGDRPARDERRDAYLEGLGIRILRYPASEVRSDLDGVAQSIYEAALAPPQSAAAPLTAPPFPGGAEATFSSPACGGGGSPRLRRDGGGASSPEEAGR